MQAQNSAEGEKPEKDRQNPAPPARSKACGFGIAKEFVDFLLDQDAPSLNPSRASLIAASAGFPSPATYHAPALAG